MFVFNIIYVIITSVFHEGVRHMANCGLCGKKLGIMETITHDFPNDSRGTCIKCHKFLVDNIQSQCNDLTIYDEVAEFKQKVIETVEPNFPVDGRNYFRSYLEFITENKYNELDRNRRMSEVREAANMELNRIQEHFVTTGYSFENYSIVKYCGVVSGETVLGTGFLSEFSASVSDVAGTEDSSFAKKMKIAKGSALEKLIRESIVRGGNALVGIDFDYINFANNMIGVSANGTSVIIEPANQR